MAKHEITTEQLAAVAHVARRAENYWNAASETTRNSGRAGSAYIAKSYRESALQYRHVYFDALGAADGDSEALDRLNDYLADDHLLIWPEAMRVCERRAAA